MNHRGRRYPPKRKPKGLLRAAKDAQAPAGWVKLATLSLAEAQWRAISEMAPTTTAEGPTDGWEDNNARKE